LKNTLKEGIDFPFQSFSSDEEFPQDEATVAAKKAFNINYLFPWQRLVIQNILDSARSVTDESIETTEQNDIVCRGRQIVLLPTGAGKSLCFLTPSILLKGATLIIYPLLALMTDQKRRMEEAGIPCVEFRGGQTKAERNKNLLLIKEQKVKVILTNPESLQDGNLIKQLKECSISHIAIDEAHCVAEWGDTFRPAYLTLGQIIKDLDITIVTAFTATASPPVLKRIGEVLFNDDYHLVQSKSDRENIHYKVIYAYAKNKAALKECVKAKKPLIIFCSTRRRTENMARLVNSYYGFKKAQFYHAGLTKDEKKQTEEWFFNSTDGILTATCAYGMGMDKGNIFTVIHLDAPEHIENFIQEAGRAGRKGDSVSSILIWSYKDQSKWIHTKENTREKIIGSYANTKDCRRNFLLRYINGQEKVCFGCDICDSKKEGKTIDFHSKDAEFAFNFIKKHRRLYTYPETVHSLTEKFNQNDITYYTQNIWEAQDIQEILSQLICKKKIKKMGGLWKNHLDIMKRKTSKRKIPLIIIHYLHQLRLVYRHFQQELVEVLQQLA